MMKERKKPILCILMNMNACLCCKIGDKNHKCAHVLTNCICGADSPSVLVMKLKPCCLVEYAVFVKQNIQIKS